MTSKYARGQERKNAVKSYTIRSYHGYSDTCMLRNNKDEAKFFEMAPSSRQSERLLGQRVNIKQIWRSETPTSPVQLNGI